MSIVCEDVASDCIKSSYGSNNKFVTAYPSNSITPLGDKWKFTPCFLPAKYKSHMDDIYNFEVRPTDIFVISFPKCGSTWSQEMIWLLNNNLDYKAAREIHMAKRFVELDIDIAFNELTLNIPKILAAVTSTRHIKTHIPAGLLPQQIWTVKPKIIYVSRGVKDAAVSYYHHYRNFQFYKETLDNFLDAFLDDKVNFAPQHGHIKDFLSLRDQDNILFITFEEMKNDLMNVLKKTASFLGKTYSNEELLNLEQYLSFESMKSNQSVETEDFYKTFLKRPLLQPDIAKKSIFEIYC